MFQPWDTLKLLARFLQESLFSPGRFVADCLGVPELPEEMRRIRMTQEYFNQVWERLLDMLGVGLVPFNRLVLAVCGGDPAQLCYQCGDEVNLVDVDVDVCLVGSPQALKYRIPVPTLMLDHPGVVYSLCAKGSCHQKQSTSPSFRQGLLRVLNVSTGLAFQYHRELCDYCGWFNQEARGHRCAGCKTKIYCGVECLNKDKVHQKLCASGKGEKRKKKRDNDRRLEKGKDECERMLNDLDI